MPPAAGQAGPLSAADLRTLEEATRRGKKVRRAASVAMASGSTLGFFAIVSVAFALPGLFTMDGAVSMVTGIALGALTYNELRGAAMLRRFDPAGAKRLAYNQIALGVLIVAYAAWSMLTINVGTMLGAAGASGDAQVDEMMGQIGSSFEHIGNLVKYGLYGSVAVAGIVGPGLTAWYYATRGRLVRDVLAETSPWAIAAMRATAG